MVFLSIAYLFLVIIAINIGLHYYEKSKEEVFDNEESSHSK